MMHIHYRGRRYDTTREHEHAGPWYVAEMSGPNLGLARTPDGPVEEWIHVWYVVAPSRDELKEDDR